MIEVHSRICLNISRAERWENERKAANDDDILTCASYVCGCTDLVTPNRKRDVVTARMIAMAYIRRNKTYSLHKIAAIFGKDHATVLHSVRKYNDLIEIRDKPVIEMRDRFLSKLKEISPTAICVI